MEDVIGWYHSHPALGVFMSGTDVRTQRIQQQFQDPYVGIVVRKIFNDKKKLTELRLTPFPLFPPENHVWELSARTQRTTSPRNL